MQTTEAFEIIPEIGVPYEPSVRYVDLMERATAACATASLLDLNMEMTDSDYQTASILTEAYATDPEGASRAVSNNKAATLRPAALVTAGRILDTFGQVVVEHSVHIRHLVTNKLLIESENEDARIRLRALELLGKISDVGLFTERSEVVHTHQSSDELREKLRGKLKNLVKTRYSAQEEEDAEDAEVVIDAELVTEGNE